MRVADEGGGRERMGTLRKWRGGTLPSIVSNTGNPRFVVWTTNDSRLGCPTIAFYGKFTTKRSHWGWL